jgi:Meiotically up-regulated gene 113
MGAAVKNISSGTGMRKAARVGRGRQYALDGVQAAEINWAPIAAMFDHAIGRASATFVYFIAEQPDGPLKIGTAVDPIERRRQLQTGNPRHLRIERLVYGERRVESLLHRTFSGQVIPGSRERRSQFDGRFAVDTEWFSAESRPLILAAAEEIAERQLATDGATNLTLGQIVVDVVCGLPIERTVGDEVRLLAEGAGYVVHKLRAA